MKIKRIEASKYVQERVLVYPEEGDPLRVTRDKAKGKRKDISI